MKCLLMILVIVVAVYACDKQTDAVYDSHLFGALQAKKWVFDSAMLTDSVGVKSSVYAVDSVKEINRFNSQLYTIDSIRISGTDTTLLDSSSNQIIYNSPNRIYFYNMVSQQIMMNHYLDIDTVNTEALILTKTDTLKTISRNYYHAQ